MGLRPPNDCIPFGRCCIGGRLHSPFSSFSFPSNEEDGKKARRQTLIPRVCLLLSFCAPANLMRSAEPASHTPCRDDRFFDNAKYILSLRLLNENDISMHMFWLILYYGFARHLPKSTTPVIGAGSVVTHDVPDYAIIGGNPARVIRLRK